MQKRLWIKSLIRVNSAASLVGEACNPLALPIERVLGR
jgi:hypothetical protein